MITLQVNGRTEQIAEKPTVGKWFKVNPLAIDQNLFREKRRDSRQEETRQIILAAFEEMKKNPKYEKPFMTFIPKKTWESKNVGELKELASKLGNHNADWVEQTLEWAQRIANGETWEAVCNKKDTANWYRLVAWENGYYRLVGGSRNCCDDYSASYVYAMRYYDFSDLSIAIPLVVSYQ